MVRLSARCFVHRIETRPSHGEAAVGVRLSARLVQGRYDKLGVRRLECLHCFLVQLLNAILLRVAHVEASRFSLKPHDASGVFIFSEPACKQTKSDWVADTTPMELRFASRRSVQDLNVAYHPQTKILSQHQRKMGSKGPTSGYWRGQHQ